MDGFSCVLIKHLPKNEHQARFGPWAIFCQPLVYTILESKDLCFTIDMTVVNDYISYFSYFRQTVYFFFFSLHVAKLHGNVMSQIWRCHILMGSEHGDMETDTHQSKSLQLYTTAFLHPS